MSLKSTPYNINEVKRSYFLNLFSENSEKKTVGTKVSEYTWRIRDLQLGSIAEIGLIQMASNHAHNNKTYCIRCLNTYADGYDSYNVTSAILYLGSGLTNPEITSYHKLISNNLNSITLVITDDITSSSGIYSGIDANISFGIVLEIIDYVDSLQNF